jgi:hypothetical protein
MAKRTVKSEVEMGGCARAGELVRRVRLAVDGEVALFVSNRHEPQLKHKLETELGLELDWCVLNPRRLQAAAERVRCGRYSLIIVATGFVSHSVERVLGKAAKSAGVPFVRARRGRLRATAHAISRFSDSSIVDDSND